MKRILIIALIAILNVACGSDKLSKSQAKKLLNKCFKAKPIQKYASITIGENLISPTSKISKENLKKYEKLADEGYLKIEPLKKRNSIWKEARFYNLILTDKAENYTGKITKGSNYRSLKSFRYDIDKILEIHENPASNTAMVKVQFKSTDITPFVILSGRDPKKPWIKKYRFTKTNEGWRYCDKS